MNFFSSVGESVSKSVNPTMSCPLSFGKEKPNTPDLDLKDKQGLCTHFCDIIRNFESKVSQDLDGLKLLKSVRHASSVPLSHEPCLRYPVSSLTNSKKSRVVSVFKSGDVKNCDNYRPIVLVSTLSKIFEKIVALQLTNHLDINNLVY